MPSFTELCDLPGADLEATNAKGHTILSSALRSSSFFVANALLNKLREIGKKEVARDANGESVVAAATCSSKEIHKKNRNKIHRKKMDNPAEHFITNLLSSDQGKCAMLDTLSVNPNTGDTILMESVHSNNLPFFQQVLSFCSHILSTKNFEGETVLHIACRINWREAIELLLETEIDLFAKNEQGETAAEVLLGHRFSVDDTYHLMLLKMSGKDDVEEVESKSGRPKRRCRMASERRRLVMEEEEDNDKDEDFQEEEEEEEHSRKKRKSNPKKK